MLQGCTLIIPFRDPGAAKTRLSGMLTDRQRADLARYMFGHVLSIANQVLAPADIVVVTQSVQVREACRGRAEVLLENEGNLNGALSAALAALSGLPPRVIGIVHADLPLLTPDDLRIILDIDQTEVGLAADLHKQGTNAMSFWSRPGMRPRFGEGSFRAHMAEAMARGLETWPVVTPGLAQDVDLPDDLPLVERGRPLHGAGPAPAVPRREDAKGR